MPHEPRNLAASVRQKLFDLARSRNEDFGLMLADFPTLLPAPNPRLLTYPEETVVAEKFEAMVLAMDDRSVTKLRHGR